MRKYNWKGEIKTIGQLAKEYNILPATINSRLKKGWTLEDSLNTPVDTNRAKQIKKKEEKKTRHTMSYADHLKKAAEREGYTDKEIKEYTRQAKTGISPINITPNAEERKNLKKPKFNPMSWGKARDNGLKNLTKQS